MRGTNEGRVVEVSLNVVSAGLESGGEPAEDEGDGDGLMQLVSWSNKSENYNMFVLFFSLQNAGGVLARRKRS